MLNKSLPMSDKKNFNFKVPKTKSNLIKEILKRWWYTGEFREQARRAFGFSQIEPYMPKSKSNGENATPESPVLAPEIGNGYLGVN